MEAITKIWFTEEAVCIKTADGIEGMELLSDYPGLKYATPAQLEKYEISKFGIHWAELDEDLSFEGFFCDKTPRNSLEKAFKSVPEVNVSGVARRMGIPQSVMASYLCGAKKPSESRKAEIENTLHQIGQELLSIHL